MEFVVCGWPPDGPQLRLDHRQFAYAGKFVMTSSGKATIRDPDDASNDGGEFDDDVLAAVAFNDDRTDPSTLWLRYITVRRDRRGEELGARLARFIGDRAIARGYERVRIAVNNPFAYEAMYKAGFGYTGETTGIAELVCDRPGDRSRERYQQGLDRYRSRDLSAEERSFLRRKYASSPPEPIDSPE